MRPCCGVCTRCSRLISVVLPAPVGPTIATVCPAFTSNETSATPCPEFGNSKLTFSKRTWPVTCVEFAQPGRFLRLGGGVLELVEVLELHARVEYLVDEGRNLVEAADQQRREAGEGDDVADPEFAARHQQRADQQHHHHRDGRGQPMQRAGQRPPVEHRDSAPSSSERTWLRSASVSWLMRL